MLSEHVEKLEDDSDLTPYSFMRAHDAAVRIWWDLRPEDLDRFYNRVLIVSPAEDLAVLDCIRRIEALAARRLPVIFAEIPEYSWVLFVGSGSVAVYSLGA